MTPFCYTLYKVDDVFSKVILLKSNIKFFVKILLHLE